MYLEHKFVFGVNSAISLYTTWRFGLDQVLLLKEYGLQNSWIQSLILWEEWQLTNNSWTEEEYLPQAQLLNNVKLILNFVDQLKIIIVAFKNIKIKLMCQ